MKTALEELTIGVQRECAGLKTRGEFGWKGRVAAPHTTGGILVIQTNDPAHQDAMEALIDSEVALAVRRFIPAFIPYAISTGLAEYQEKVSNVLQELGFDRMEAIILSRLAWGILIDGLNDLCQKLDHWKRRHGLEFGAPFAPLHIWALSEAAGCYLTCIDPTGEAEEVTRDAKQLDREFGEYGLNFNNIHNPYACIVVKAVE